MALFWDRVAKETAINICENLFASFCRFAEQQQKPRKNAGILPFGPKPARAQIHPNCKIHLFFTVKNTFMLFYQEMSFSLASKKTL